MIKRILVANRGEIAVRVMRSCREMEITSIAIFSEADRTAKHVLYADEAYCVGPAASKESYLNIEKIIEVAKANHSSGIWIPGRECGFCTTLSGRRHYLYRSQSGNNGSNGRQDFRPHQND